MISEKEFQRVSSRVRNFYLTLKQSLFAEERPLLAEVAVSHDPVAFAARQRLACQPAAEGTKWGSLWDSSWWNLHGEIPAEWAGREVVCRLNLGGEILLFDAAGMPLLGLTNSSIMAADYTKELYYLTASAVPGKFTVIAEAAANALLGADSDPASTLPGSHAPRADLGLAQVMRYGVFRREVRELLLDTDTALCLLGISPRTGNHNSVDAPWVHGSYREARIMAALERAVDAYADSPENASKARAELRGILAERNGDGAMRAVGVGHAHIDTGWLWPVRETVRKVARTFASQLDLLERFPEYVFGASQAQHYAFVKEHYPALFERIKAAVRSGRWELQGGMWVECDCNLPNGESLVRQFLHGKNFFMDEFGVDVRNLWLPDVFGYSAALPQIMKKAGCDAFVTQKISWNQVNRFPFHAFRWYGIDGTSVLSYFPPEDNYNARLDPIHLNYGANNFNEHAKVDEFLSLFGIGDGGGGPSEDHIERGLRLKDLNGCPKFRFGRADEFLRCLGKREAELPRWHGELYLEMHRGTLTVQAHTKAGNRRCEQRLMEAEILATLLPVAEYPAATFDKAWKLLLINQFHDILPGSGITDVYRQTAREHESILTMLSGIRERVAGRCFAADANALSCVNTLSSPVHELVELPEEWASVQEVPCERYGEKVYADVCIPGTSTLVLHRSREAARCAALPAGDALVLENDLIRYEFNAEGEVISAVDKLQHCERLAAPGNRLLMFVDRPACYDAWEIDADYERMAEDSVRCVGVERLCSGALKQEIRFHYQVGSGSRITQTATLAVHSARLDFHTHADWHEEHRMLRVRFEAAAHALEAAYDIQYGFVRRPTHRNTSWDAAKFEVAGQRYFDLSDDLGGLAILSDSKYGCKTVDSVMELALLRSPVFPDPQADRGEHDFTYSLLPHAGELADSCVMHEAAALNRPLCCFAGADGSAAKFPCRLAAENIGASLEVVKKAERSSAWILRVVETRGRHTEATLELEPSIRRACGCDLMEWHEEENIPLSLQHTICFKLAPFEIKTVKLEF